MSTVLIEQKNPQIAVATLNRPERRNALTIELLSELCAAVEATEADQERRILILRGAGKAFCAGLDLQETLVTEDAHRSAGMVARTLRAIAETRLITIAQVHGAAVAGGAGLMSACDFVIATARTKIGYPEGKRGLVAGLVLTFLRRQLRERDIRELLFTGDLITAERAKEIGLINRVVAPDELENETDKIVSSILQNAPHALAQTKRLIEELWSSPVRKDVEYALHYHTQARESEEAKEGIAAFLEKRSPRWMTD
jgi:methylglutaconyl-CoA hydratase